MEDGGIGEEVFVLGFPLIGDGMTEQSPSVQATRLSNKTSNYIKMSSPLGVGCSGGPVYHPRSKSVIGIAARELIQLLIQDERVLTGGTSFAIRIDHALPLIRKNSINFRLIPSSIKINQFREKVKAVYSSLGSKVIDKLGSGTRELDLLVTSQTAGSTINLGVFCILSQEIIGVSDIENVYSKVPLFARTSEIKIHKFVVIGSEEFSREAKDFGVRFDIDLMTFSELSTKLIDVQPYIHQLIQDYDQSKLSKYYINAPCSLSHEKSNEVIDSVVGYVKDSFDKVGHKSIAVLGDFGMGKTSLAKRAAYEFALSYNRKEIGSRIPILIPLKEYKNIQKIQEAVQQILESKYGLQIPLNIMLSMQRSGQMVFILDGFDEMSDRVDLTMINENIRELLSLIEIENNRLLLTCRTHFFRDRVDEEKLQNFNIIYLIPWDEHQLIEYLRNRFPENWEHYLERIHNIFNLEELSQTPVFLEMIVESLPELEIERDLTSTTLSEIYTKKRILKQEIKRGNY